MKGKETVYIPWMNEMSDHHRSLSELKDTQHQSTTALCPEKDRGMIFKNIMALWKAFRGIQVWDSFKNEQKN